jgi:hypothetical protein
MVVQDKVYTDEDFEIFRYAPLYMISNPDIPLILIKNSKGQILKPSYAGRNNEYLNYRLMKDSKRITLGLHEILAIQYKGHRPGEDGYVVEHIDKNPRNNSLDNLRLV